MELEQGLTRLVEEWGRDCFLEEEFEWMGVGE